MKKRITHAEVAYLLGLLLLAIGTAIMERTNLGLSMVVAPAYILHLKISAYLPFFSFGMAEYTLQAVLILVIILAVRKFKVSYLFSFLTAVLYGFLLDAFLFAFSMIPSLLWVRITIFVAGFLIVAFGVALLFKTYISPEAYELFVKEISSRYKIDIHRLKTIYDISSLLLSVVMSFAFFGLGVFRGISWGTLVAALGNGLAIKLAGKIFDKFFEFNDGLKWRSFFEK